VQVTRSELLLNPVLAGKQPVHGGVQVILAGISHAKLSSQRAGVPQACRGQFGGWANDARSHHGSHQVALAAGLGGQQASKAQAFHSQRHGLHMAVGA